MWDFAIFAKTNTENQSVRNKKPSPKRSTFFATLHIADIYVFAP